MTTYLQCLDHCYNRYQRNSQTLKLAKLQDGRYGGWLSNKLGLGGKTGAQYFTEDNEGWSNEDAFNALFNTLSPQQQQSYTQSGAGRDINSLIATAMANPKAYGNMLTYIAKDQELALQGKRSALSTVLDQNPFAKQVIDQMRTQMSDKMKETVDIPVLKQLGMTNGMGRALGGHWTDGMLQDNVVNGMQDYMTGGQQQQGQQQTTPTNPQAQQQPQQQTQQQDPSMWSYMLPALAAGAPLALLGGLGGGSKWGLGLLGLTGLAGLGYGMARQNGWEGWSPINNFADTVNGWFGMGNNSNQNTQNQDTNRPPTAQELNAPGAYYGGPGEIVDNSKVPGNVSYEAMDNPEDFGLDPNQSWQMSIGPGDRYITNGNGTTYFTSAQNVANQGNIRQNAMKNPAGTAPTTPGNSTGPSPALNNVKLPEVNPVGPNPPKPAGPPKPPAGIPMPQSVQPNPGAGTSPTPKPKTKTGGFLPNPRAIGTGYNNLKKMTAPQNTQPVQQPAPQPAAQKPAFNPRMIGTGSQNYKQLTAPKTTQAPQAPKTIDPRWMGTGYQNYKQLTAPPATQQQQTPAQEKQNPKTTWPWGISPANLRI